MSSMDGDGGLNMPNWGYYEPPAAFKSNLGLQLMPSMADRKPLIGSGRDSNILANVNNGGGGPFHHHRDLIIPTSHFQMDYMRDTWIHRDSKFFNMFPPNPAYGVMPETTTSATSAVTTPLHQHQQHQHHRHHPVQMLRQPESSNDERMMVRTDGIIPPDSINGPPKKRSSGKTEKSPRVKKPKKAAAKDGSGGSVQRAKAAKKVTEVVINGIDMDISSIPIPVCSCTGTPQQCYRWGSGGWQSACCTTVMSMYPLPMSTKRRGARIAGRKMSFGAFKKVLEKLAAEGYNFTNPIDLRTYWAKHGTNKFVTIR